MIAGSAGAILDLVNDPDPFVSVTSPAASDVLKTTAPLDPAFPVWMCAMLIGVPAGQPVILTVNVAVPPVTLPAASFVVSNTIFDVPLQLASALDIAGTSFEDSSVAVNVGFTVLGDVDGVESF